VVVFCEPFWTSFAVHASLGSISVLFIPVRTEDEGLSYTGRHGRWSGQILRRSEVKTLNLTLNLVMLQKMNSAMQMFNRYVQFLGAKACFPRGKDELVPRWPGLEPGTLLESL
jgi:hypothetical protein